MRVAINFNLYANHDSARARQAGLIVSKPRLDRQNAQLTSAPYCRLEKEKAATLEEFLFRWADKESERRSNNRVVIRTE